MIISINNWSGGKVKIFNRTSGKVIRLEDGESETVETAAITSLIILRCILANSHLILFDIVNTD
ncbi:hypothetical protein NVP1069O_01 [Vibrio phage 1.069.O._10N.286.49.F11]|uniref:Uncharacterized protein n=6 Tax=Autolykiviridae TaxID=2184034 RepID=A0A2I7S829_9VIRU|nr:hypothetical protein KMD65_gp01 [Vibrio phage 1.008.O._10N.286.54.E5]AUR81630.1 hypothetical protein NVP1011O_01 [Vibrio phage 1.011.O._10N.286.49.B11]AUR83768.1 hypothetical protein NVP1040O_01 [Vibrio phage 1.040.O._10N.286.45.B9]AUR84647.1 hypothetical protein NVP1062O_01 [Vibrio phage 1.062.O._10N.286.55.C3]AUR85144.1 hypothetical protein NVP1069O_01 [Vibrio phage 1.069.O._10N.286.49.F11]AUS02061.1 hypothetical protein NVP2092O_01 [Vibrio phage 2.092.O._10N.286.52.B7]